MGESNIFRDLFFFLGLLLGFVPTGLVNSTAEVTRYLESRVGKYITHNVRVWQNSNWVWFFQSVACLDLKNDFKNCWRNWARISGGLVCGAGGLWFFTALALLAFTSWELVPSRFV